jgi:hypothetical protein
MRGARVALHCRPMIRGLPLALLLVAAACGSGASSPPSSDAGAADVAALDVATPKCTDLGYTGAPVTPVAVSGAAPASQGGTLADGTYRLTAYRVYNTQIDPNNLPQLQGSIKLTADAYQIAFLSSQGEDKESGSVATTGTTLTLTMACPTQQAESPRRYTADATHLDLYDVSGTNPTDPVEIATYTRE